MTSRKGVAVSAPGKKMSRSPVKPHPSATAVLEGEGRVKEKVLAIIDEKKNEEATLCKEVSVDQIDEFFGDGKKSSQKVFYAESEEEEEGGCGGVESEEEEEEGVEGVLSAEDSRDNSLDIQVIMRRREEW